MQHSAPEKLYLMWTRRAGQTPQPVPHLDGPVIWLHADTQNAIAQLDALSGALMLQQAQRGHPVSVLLTHAAGLHPPTEIPGRATMPIAADSAEIMTAIMARLAPVAVLVATRRLPVALISSAATGGAKVMIADMDSPRFAGFWGSVPGLARALLGRVHRVFLSKAAHRAGWAKAGVSTEQMLLSGPLNDAPLALGCNENERDLLAQSFRQRTVWLAIGVPEVEEAMIVAAHRAALRDSHRVALILHPADPMRGPALKAELAPKFNTALRSDDDLITPETQVYIVDTEGERGLWYRLAVACYIGGTLDKGGATVTPMEAAGLGCAVVHGRETGQFGAAFHRLATAKATSRIQRPEALGQAICAALRPDQAAQMAHQGWQVVSEGAETADMIIGALLETLGPAGGN
ncbi:3-deoxy-D-manno-octulosonic acid transferase [Roseinatronobacter sp. NSM]|uniref:3-deoxy-D-manno-octulosonic acid transferase n=1 Tax=Roseinatronobacter sp. NSM TaxID=3457785 RepID=UPI0040358A1F